MNVQYIKWKVRLSLKDMRIGFTFLHQLLQKNVKIWKITNYKPQHQKDHSIDNI